MADTSMASILALGIFPNDDPVQFAILAIAQRRFGSAENFCRTDVGVLLERLTYSKTQAPERNVIWNIY
jgi:hypothetical protein